MSSFPPLVTMVVLSFATGCGAEPAVAPAAPAVASAAAPTAEPPVPVAKASAAPSPAPAPVADAKADPKPETIVAGEPLGSPVSNAPTTSTGPSGNNAATAISALKPKFKACYRQAKGAGPDIAGMVSCGLRVTKEGKVASISVTRRDRLPPPLVDCLVKELKTASFGPQDEEVVIQVPVRFAVPGE